MLLVVWFSHSSLNLAVGRVTIFKNEKNDNSYFHKCYLLTVKEGGVWMHTLSMLIFEKYDINFHGDFVLLN